MRLSYLLPLLMLAVLTVPAHAQQEQGQNTLLPEIDPQDIEIRSQFRARFPGLTRQPILGFDPNPRVFQIDPDRMPFMESRDDVVASLSVSELSRPAPPDYVPMSYSAPIGLFANAGFGSYTAPEAKLWGLYKPSDRSYVGMDLDLSTSLDDHLDQRPSTYRDFAANLEFGTKLDARTQLDVFGGMRSDFNYSAGFPPSGSSTDYGQRSLTGFNLGAELRSMRNGVTGWDARADLKFNGMKVNEGGGIRQGHEAVYEVGGRYQWAGSQPRETWQVKGDVRGGIYSDEIGDGTTGWITLYGAAVYDRLFNYTTRLTAEAGAYYVANSMESAVLPGPRLSLKYWISERLTLQVQGEAAPRLFSRGQLYDRNRFVQIEQELGHSYDMRGSAEISLAFFDEGRIYGGVSYRYGDNNPVFAYEGALSAAAAAGDPPADYRVYYDDLTVARIFGGVSHALVAETIWFHAEGYLQVPRLVDEVSYHSGDRVPFMETWGLNGSISFRPINDIKVEGWADLMGGRPANSQQTLDAELDPVFLLGGRADVEISDHFGVYAKIVNLLSQNYSMWYRYPERPLQVFGGVTLKL
ncbi:MAG: hypothetical protein U5K31_07995 [Balneolaceae bacterium]|nr:hypothetical protein [Balneolaceae bacterium]